MVKLGLRAAPELSYGGPWWAAQRKTRMIFPHHVQTCCLSHTPMPCQATPSRALAIRRHAWMETSSTVTPNHLCSLGSFQEIPGRRYRAEIPRLGNQRPACAMIHSPLLTSSFQSLCTNSSLWPWTWPSKTFNENQEHNQGFGILYSLACHSISPKFSHIHPWDFFPFWLWVRTLTRLLILSLSPHPEC